MLQKLDYPADMSKTMDILDRLKTCLFAGDRKFADDCITEFLEDRKNMTTKNVFVCDICSYSMRSDEPRPTRYFYGLVIQASHVARYEKDPLKAEKHICSECTKTVRQNLEG